MSVLPCCALEFPSFYCDLPSAKAPKESCAVHWDFHIFESILCGLLLSQQILKLHDSSFFLCIAAWFNSSLCDGPRRRVSVCYSRKRAEAEGRKGSFPCSKAMSSHHPTDPVELRRINFQTPGKPGKRSRTHTGTESTCSYMCVLQSTVLFCFFCFLKINYGVVSFSAYRVSVYRGYRRLSS